MKLEKMAAIGICSICAVGNAVCFAFGHKPFNLIVALLCAGVAIMWIGRKS